MMAKPVFQEVEKQSRIYHFPGGETVKVHGIVGLCVSKSGFHLLNGDGGAKYIVAPGWLYVELDMKEWSTAGSSPDKEGK